MQFSKRLKICEKSPSHAFKTGFKRKPNTKYYAQVIAILERNCLGGAAEIAMAADIRIATENARVRHPSLPNTYRRERSSARLRARENGHNARFRRSQVRRRSFLSAFRTADLGCLSDICLTSLAVHKQQSC